MENIMIHQAAKLLDRPKDTEYVKMKERQVPLCKHYLAHPQAAEVIDSARTSSSDVDAANPLQSAVSFCDSNPVKIPVGVHRAVGGDNDNPTPGDILCGAIASCLDSTIRIISNRLGVKLKELNVEVLGHVDVRGTLRVDKSVPVSFQKFEVNVLMKPAGWIPGKIIEKILHAAEYSCIVIQTIKGGATVTVTRVK